MIVSNNLLKVYTDQKNLINFNNGEECFASAEGFDEYIFEITVPIAMVKGSVNYTELSRNIIVLQQADPDVFEPPKETEEEVVIQPYKQETKMPQPEFKDISKDNSRNSKSNIFITSVSGASKQFHKQQEIQMTKDGAVIGRAWVLKIGPGDQVKLKFDDEAMKILGDDMMSALKYLTVN